MQNTSLTATGMPCSGPRTWPRARSWSHCPASASACSAVTVTKALSFGFNLSMVSRHWRVSSTALSLRSRCRRGRLTDRQQELLALRCAIGLHQDSDSALSSRHALCRPARSRGEPDASAGGRRPPARPASGMTRARSASGISGANAAAICFQFLIGGPLYMQMLVTGYLVFPQPRRSRMPRTATLLIMRRASTTARRVRWVSTRSREILLLR